MTYRDEKDALEARVEALGSKVRATETERQELQQELADARRDLAAMQPTEVTPPPRARLLLGLIGAGLAVLGNLLYLSGAVPPRWTMTLLSALASIGLALGLLGLLRLTRQKLMLIAMILCLAEVALDPLSLLLPQIDLLSWAARPLATFKWALFIAFSVVVGIALLGAARAAAALPRWLGITAGWLKIAGAALSSVALLSFVSESYFGGQALYLVSSLLYLAGSAALALVFFMLLRGPKEGGGAVRP